MSLTGSGNTQSKKAMFGLCPECGKKGYYQPTGLFFGDGKIVVFERTCMFCHFNDGKEKE